MFRNKLMIVVALLVITSFVLSACQGAAPTPERVVETVIVEREGETVIETVVVTQEVEVEAPTVAGEPIPAEGLVECLPLPEVAFSGGSAHLASLASQQQTASAAAEVNTAPSKPVLAPVQQAGNIYRVGVFEDVTTLNFWAANGPDNTIYNSYMLPPPLTLYVLSDKYFTFVPQAAAVAEPPALAEEGEFWVVEIPIREDISWSDGEPFTAEDVAFTANAALALGIVSGNWSTWYDANFLDRIEAVDDYTAKFYYSSRPGLSRHEYGTLQAPILAEHYWALIVEEALAPVNALGDSPSEEDLAAAQAEAQDILFSHVPDGEPQAGSWVLDRWEAGAFLENGARDDYFERGLVIEQWANAAYRDSEGVTVDEPEGEVETTLEIGPFVDAVVYTIYGSQDAAILALQNGEVDFVLNSLGLQRGLANRIQTDPNLAVLENPTNGFRYLSFNNRRRPMNDCSFRQAVAVLIDKEFVTGTILQGAAFPLYTFVPQGNAFWYYDDIPKLGEALDREQRTNLAVAILEQAGYSWEGDQKPAWDADNRQVTQAGRLIMPDGTPVPPLTMPAPSPGYDPLRSTFAIWIETWLNEFGIPLQANLAGFNVIVPIIFTEQDFDMYILGWSLSIFPDFLYDFFAEEQAALDGNNAGGYVNPEFEEAAGQLTTCTSLDECKEISQQVQEILATEVPYVLLFDTGIIEAYRSASVEYPFTEALAGLQFYHIQNSSGLQAQVRVR